MPPRPLRRGDVVRIRNERWAVVRHVQHDAASIVDVSGCDRGNRRVRTRFLLPFEPVEYLPDRSMWRAVRPRAWRARVRHVLAGGTPSWDTLRSVAAADIDLLPFQLEPALAVVRGAAARLLIADAVGLGKTVQAGVIVAETLERNPDAHILVVTPASVREQWRDELRARFGLEPAVFDSTALAHAAAAAGANPWSVPLAITSIDYIKRPEVLRSLEALVWDVVVIDEAHGLAGRSDRHTAARALGERARTFVLLTATPHGGDDEAFARLCRIGDLDAEFPLLVFRRTRSDAGLRSSRRTAWLRVTPTDPEKRMHRALDRYARLVWRQSTASPAARLATVVLTKRACSSAASLGRSIERRMWLLSRAGIDEEQLQLPLGFSRDDDHEPDAELAAPGLVNAEDERRWLERLLQLSRHAARHESKLAAVARLLRRAREPAIVFTEYRDTLATVASALDGRRIVQLHGGLSATDRGAALRQFANGRADVLLATDAASEGLNLQQRCRLVINLELPWSPARLEQRVGRVDRIGQPRRVHQVHLIAAGTSEELAIAPVVRRRSVAARDALGAMQSGAALPDDVFTIDLSDKAAATVAHARTARAYTGRQREWTADHRPFAAALDRRPARGYWAFSHEFEDAAGEVVWDALFGVHHRVAGATLGDPEAVRTFARHTVAALLNSAHQHAVKLRDTLQHDAEAAVTLALRREQAIVRAIEARRARLAAALVQPGLFGRHLERDAAARDDVLLQALRCCSGQLARLERRARLTDRPAEPRFAVFLR